MAWYRSRESTKPTEQQQIARKIAMDAFLAGRMTEGEQILKTERTKLSKTDAKKIAHLIAKDGRFDDATKVLLMSSWDEKSAALELAEQPSAKVGDVLYTSGGYNETNVSYYQVVAASGTSATIRKIEKRIFERSQYENAVVPVQGAFVGPPLKKRVQKATYGGPYKIKISDGTTAYLWDGKPQRETAAGYGH